ncbi:MAG: phenylacetate--CoA ligase family protein [Thermoplasmatales archaeon]|nr:MAG: phenylacetate--CoA ligase family protein [Thermoplasmatales archaeon]
MNSFSNPIFLLKILKSYLVDINRLRRLNDEKLRKYQDKRLRKMVKFAYTVPLYHDKYKKEGIHPEDIRGIMDIKKLPTISKYDFKKYYPDGIISSKINKNKLIEVTTSGTTGKSLSIYVDMFDIVAGLFGYIRSIREHGIDWRKDKLTIIADFAPHTVESGYIHKGLQPRLSSNLFFKNMQWLNTNDPPEKVIEEINKFKPDFIGGYVGMLGHLALLKEKGFGKDISPRVIATTGSPLSNSLKDLMMKSFNAEIFQSYGSTESGSIAFQCKNGKYHVMSDLVHLEYLKNGKEVSSEEAGKIVLTKLYGIGTPIIRYDAINDIVSPSVEKCNCGLSGGLIEKIYGRDDISLYSPDGRIILPASFGEIFSRILYELKTNKLKDAIIIQHSLKKIELQVVIDEKQRDIGPSVEKIFSVLRQGLQEKLGSNVEIITKEVKKIDRQKARIIQKLDREKLKITGYV